MIGFAFSVRLSRLGVRQRLVLGVGFLVALLLLMAGGAVWQLRTMSAQLENVVQVHGHRGELAQRLHAAQLLWMERLRAALIISDPEDLKIQFAQVEDAARRYVEAEEALAGTGVDLAEVRKLRESVSPVYQSALRSLLGAAGIEGALALLLPAETAEARWRQLIDAMVDQASRSSRDEFEHAKRRQQTATAILAVVASVAIAAALVMAVGVVR